MDHLTLSSENSNYVRDNGITIFFSQHHQMLRRNASTAAIPATHSLIFLMAHRQHISRDLRKRIPYLRFVEHFTVKEICRILGIKKTAVYDTLANYRKYGVVHNPKAFTECSPGCRRKLDATDIQFIKSLLHQNPCIYLDKLQNELLS